MTAQQGGGVSKRRTVYPRISTTVSLANKEAAVLYANELLTTFVPEDIWPLTTTTVQEESEGCFSVLITTDA